MPEKTGEMRRVPVAYIQPFRQVIAHAGVTKPTVLEWNWRLIYRADGGACRQSTADWRCQCDQTATCSRAAYCDSLRRCRASPQCLLSRSPLCVRTPSLQNTDSRLPEEWSMLDDEHSLCTAPSSGTPCRTTSAHSRTTSPLNRPRKPGFSPDTNVFSALETFVITAIYKSTFTISYHDLNRPATSRPS